MKDLIFLETSQKDLSKFPEEVKRAAGFELWHIQLGLMPSDFKSMPTVGPSVYELRIRIGGEWRVIYLANQADAVYVLHCFQKKTPKTSQPDLDLAIKRFKFIGLNHAPPKN